MPTKTNKPAKSAKAARVEPFIITRTFEAPRALVVRAWTEREHLMHWWGPKGITVLPGKLELKAGGIFHYAMQMADGKLMWGKWAIREVALPERLVWVNGFSDENMGTTRHPMGGDWPLHILTTVTFGDEGQKTKVTVRWEPIDPTPAEAKHFSENHASMEGGWGGSFEELAAHLPKMATDGQLVAPYLTVDGAAKAIDYYKEVFGAVERSRMPAQDGKRVMHCALLINGASLLLSDAFPEHGGPGAPQPGGKQSVAVTLDLDEPTKLDDIYARAIKTGSTGDMPPADMFWGARFAAFTDPFGHRWMLNADRSKT
jgi:uncharacterized glyoxalase superfamily protein PhnB/uncharacterized protein YndB with AHSA1/START domain